MKRIKKYLILIVMFTFASVILPVHAVAGNGKVIRNNNKGIPDRVLYQSILHKLNKNANDTFTEKEAAKIIKLVAENDNKKNKIKSLKGIHYLKNLSYLDVSSNQLNSIYYLKKLGKLQYLNVSINNLTSLKGIDTLYELDYLDASQNKLTSLSELENLTKLTTLEVYYNQIREIGAVKKLLNLKYLGIGSNKIKSLKGIEKLKGLESIDAAVNRLRKLPDLKKHSNLSEVNFKYNCLNEKELNQKIPYRLGRNNVWYKSQVKLQNLVKTINLVYPASFEKINMNTKKISGIANKNSTVSIRDPKGKKIVSVKTDSKGKFTFKNLNLKKWAGMTLSLQSYVVDQLYGEKNVLKEVKFTIPN